MAAGAPLAGKCHVQAQSRTQSKRHRVSREEDLCVLTFLGNMLCQHMPRARHLSCGPANVDVIADGTTNPVPIFETSEHGSTDMHVLLCVQPTTKGIHER
jgi:hypothetical protein